MVINSQQDQSVDLDVQKQFPDFLWLFRDSILPLPLDENGVQLTLTEYVKSQVLFNDAPTSRAATTTDGVINALLHLFPSFECCKLPFPSVDPRVLNAITLNQSKLSAEFNEGVNELSSSILSGIRPKRSLTAGAQQFMNGSLLATFVETCKNSLKSSDIIPELSSGWQVAMQHRLEALLNKLVSDYVNEMDANKCGMIAMEESMPDSLGPQNRQDLQISENDSGIQVLRTESDMPISTAPSTDGMSNSRQSSMRKRSSSRRWSISSVMTPLPVTPQRTLIGIHQLILNGKLEEFKQEINRSMGALSEEVKAELLTRLEQCIVQYEKTRDGNCTGRVIGGVLLKYIRQNYEKSKERCNRTLDHILTPLKKNLTKAVDSISEEYHSLAIGPAKDEVLESRMREFEEIASRLPPGSPRNLRAVGLAQTKLKIKWKRPSVHPRATRGYEVQIMLGLKQHQRGEWKTLITSTKRRAAVVTDLTPSTTYLFRVRGKNTNQIGEWSEELEVSTRIGQAQRYKVSAASFVRGSASAPFALTAETFKEGLEVYRESDSSTEKLQAGVGMVVGGLMLPFILISESLLMTSTGIETAEAVYEGTGTTSEDDLDERKAEVVSILPHKSDISSSSSSSCSDTNPREPAVESPATITEQNKSQQPQESADLLEAETTEMKNESESITIVPNTENETNTSNGELECCEHYQLNTEPDLDIESDCDDMDTNDHSPTIHSSTQDHTNHQSESPYASSLDVQPTGQNESNSVAGDEGGASVHPRPLHPRMHKLLSYDSPPSQDNSLTVLHSFAFSTENVN